MRAKILVCLVVGAAAVLSSCGSSDEADRAPPPTVTAPPPGSARARAIVDGARDALDLRDGTEQDCVVAALDDRSDLVEALGDRPLDAARSGDLRELAGSCTTRLRASRPVLDRIRATSSQPPTEPQQRCLTDALARYQPDELRRLEHPADAPLENRLRELLAVCGLPPA